MIPLPPQKWQFDAAYRKGYAHGQAMCDPDRRIQVIVAASSPAGRASGLRIIVFQSMKQGTTIDAIVSAIHSRLSPDMASQVTIFTKGAESRVCEVGDQTAISLLLPNYDATSLHLHIEITGLEPSDEKSQQANDAQKDHEGLRAKLRKAFGRGGRQSGSKGYGDADQTLGVDADAQRPSSEQNDQPPLS